MTELEIKENLRKTFLLEYREMFRNLEPVVKAGESMLPSYEMLPDIDKLEIVYDLFFNKGYDLKEAALATQSDEKYIDTLLLSMTVVRMEKGSDLPVKEVCRWASLFKYILDEIRAANN